MGDIIILSLFSFFLFEKEVEEKEGRGRAPEPESCKTLGAGSPLAGFYLGHAWSDGGSGDEDHVGSKLSRPEDLQGLGRRRRGVLLGLYHLPKENSPSTLILPAILFLTDQHPVTVLLLG